MTGRLEMLEKVQAGQLCVLQLDSAQGKAKGEIFGRIEEDMSGDEHG